MKNALSIIVCSRSGVTENEILPILLAFQNTNSSSSNVFGKSVDTNIQFSQIEKQWRALYRSLASFLKPTVEKSGELTLTFSHNLMVSAIQKRYLSFSKAAMKIHERLAKYFYECADPSQDGSWCGQNKTRALRDLPYHAIQAKLWTLVHKVLTDLCFIESKFSLGMGYDLIADYNSACNWESNANEKYSGHSEILEFMHFVKANAHILIRNPSLTLQQAANQPDHTSVAKKAQELFIKWKTSSNKIKSWINWLNKPQEQDPCKMIFTGLFSFLKKMHSSHETSQTDTFIDCFVFFKFQVSTVQSVQWPFLLMVNIWLVLPKISPSNYTMHKQDLRFPRLWDIQIGLWL